MAVCEELSPEEPVYEEHLPNDVDEAQKLAEPVLEYITIVHLFK